MKISHRDLVAMIADRLLDSMSTEDLMQFYYETQYDYFDDVATADEMTSTAMELGIIGPDESIEFTD
jgi:hypothetical protein